MKKNTKIKSKDGTNLRILSSLLKRATVLGKSSLLLILLLLGGGSAQASIIITEILADPPPGITGDANRDGVTSSTQDEFIEIFNMGSIPVDLTGWRITDFVKTRHVFSINSVLNSNQHMVIFGGCSPVLAGINWMVASTGSLGLNNAGDTVSLYDSGNNLIDRIIYDKIGEKDQSLVPLGHGQKKILVLHSLLPQANNELFSPGTSTHNFTQQPNAVPEAGSVYLFTVGMMGLYKLKLKSQNAEL